MPDEVETFGKYVLKELLRRQGSYVSIYLGSLPNSEKNVEIHVLNHSVDEKSADFQRFLNEFQTLAGLEHPNIVQVTDMGMHDNKAYYATPHTGAQPLSVVVGDANAFSLESTVNLGCQVASALEYMHGKKVIHRDIGPDSVYWQNDGNRAIIAEFALVKNFRLTNLTARGICTPSEMRVTPEQVEDLPYDERTDIYLLGDLLYWLLTSKTATTMDFNPAKPSSLNEAIPPTLDKVVMKMLKAKPDDRFQTAQQMNEALSKSLQEPED